MGFTLPKAPDYKKGDLVQGICLKGSRFVPVSLKIILSYPRDPFRIKATLNASLNLPGFLPSLRL